VVENPGGWDSGATVNIIEQVLVSGSRNLRVIESCELESYVYNRY
jgi:hypothetical protein